MAPGWCVTCLVQSDIVHEKRQNGGSNVDVANVIYQTSQSEQRIHVEVSYDFFMSYRAMS